MSKNNTITEKSIEGLDSLMENMLSLYSVKNNNVGHNGKCTLSLAIEQILTPASREKTTIVTRYGIDHKVVYIFDKTEKEPELWNIDGNPNIEDTYSESFIQYMIDHVIEQELEFNGCGHDNE